MRTRLSRVWLRVLIVAAALTLLVPGAVTPAAHGAVPTKTAATTSTDASVPKPRSLGVPAQTRAVLDFREPVDAAITDGWRPPRTPYGPGNRGWQYGTVDGDDVVAAGGGTVTFAGPVGGVLALTILHRGGLRTSYTRLEELAVTRGEHVEPGQFIGTAMTEMHLGVRLHDDYIDPGLLFRVGGLQYGAVLVPMAQ